jgi:hypothetical protein
MVTLNYYKFLAFTVANYLFNCVLGLLHRVVVGDVADVLEVHAASMFRVDMCVLVRCCVYTAL